MREKVLGSRLKVLVFAARRAALGLLLLPLFSLLTISPILPLSQAAFAQTNNDVSCNEQTGTCQTDIGTVPIDPGGFVNVILNYSVGIGGGLALILIIWGGFRIVTSNGNPEEVKKGKEIITYAIVGLILILFAVVITNVVGGGIVAIPEIGQ